jgi:Asp-tRNA(Asn)/Glu-tRNA(Gln) amidotransferase A subunit family amidase
VGLLDQLLGEAEPYVAAAVVETAEHLGALGAKVVAVQVRLLRHVGAIHLIVQHAEAAIVHGSWFDAERPHYSEAVRTRLEAGRLLPVSAYLTAQRARKLLIAEFAEKMQDLDVLLAPSAPCVAPPRDVTEVTVRGERRELRSALLACTLAPSQLACPVVSVPVGRRDGLPYGMQIIGRPSSERLVLRVAQACESRLEWRERIPPI